ncbi:hypothetical protein [Streptomyces sp. NPDC051218]|uniref:hypothetical protein n=1 Tax=Streptomyces sp. NPDC051218 TaxID=3365645 RepID=UPI0037876B6B
MACTTRVTAGPATVAASPAHVTAGPAHVTAGPTRLSAGPATVTTCPALPCPRPVTVLIPEVEPAHVWQRLLQNQRGAVLAHAVRRDTDAVICRLRFRLAAGRGRS